MRNRILSILLISIILFCGCSPTAAKQNQYAFPQDSQCNFINRNTMSITETATGNYYFLSGPVNTFLYYYETASKKCFPVCSRPDCLHADEPDSHKIMNCNACLGQVIKFVTGYLNHIYFIKQENSGEGLYYTLNEISLDGTDHKQLYTFKQNVLDIQLHRGYIYYATSDDGTKPGHENESKTTYSLYRISIDKLSQNPELIFQESNIYGQIGQILCYDHYVFFNTHFNDDSSLKTSKSFIYKYDIKANKYAQFLSVNSACLNIFNNKLVYSIYPDGTYTCDIDGKNSTKICDQCGIYCSNDSYLFIDNFAQHIVQGKQRFILVFDKNNILYKRISIDDDTIQESLGCSNNYYFLNTIGQSNKYGSISEIKRIDLGRIDTYSGIDTFYSFIPKVPYNGVNSGQ